MFGGVFLKVFCKGRNDKDSYMWDGKIGARTLSFSNIRAQKRMKFDEKLMKQ